jgi:hypothetical protein
MGKKAEVEASYFVAFLSRGQLRWRFFNLVAPGVGTAVANVSIQNKLSIAKIGVNYKF